MIRRASPNTDQIIRSLLQKAVRRGDYELTKKIISYIYFEINDFDWMYNRLAVMTFEECWPYGLYISYEKIKSKIDKASIINHYLRLADTVKNKNAAGL